MSEPKEQKVQTTIRIPLSLKQRLDDEVNRRKYTPDRITIDGAFQEAITDWLERNPQTNDAGVAVSNEGQGEPSRKPPLAENSLGQSTYETLQSSPSVSGPSSTDQGDPEGSISEYDQRLRALEAAIGAHSSELGEFKELLEDLREAASRAGSGKPRPGERNQRRAGGRSKN